jgi:transposase-like protein
LKRLSDFKMLEIVFSSFQGNVKVADLCQKHGISRSTFYRKKNCVLKAIVALMVSKEKSVGREQVSKRRKISTKSCHRCKFK